jgi:TetR/AcrR family transcriptional regulator, mexJK operon transcriptional repressor
MKTTTNTTTRRRFKPAQIATILDQVASAVRQGRNIADACRSIGVSEASYYRWRSGESRDVPRPPRADQIRDAIVGAAKGIFLRDGYAASLDAIAEAAGVARQTLYNQFGSKERLFLAVVHTIFSRMLMPVLHVDSKASFRQTLLEYSRQYIDASLDPEGLALLRLTAGQHREFPDLGRIVHSSGASRTVPVLADYLQSQIDAGNIRPVDPLIAAESFLGSLVGYARHRALVGIGVETAERRDTMLRHAVETFVRGVSTARDDKAGGTARARNPATFRARETT